MTISTVSRVLGLKRRESEKLAGVKQIYKLWQIS